MRIKHMTAWSVPRRHFLPVTFGNIHGVSVNLLIVSIVGLSFGYLILCCYSDAKAVIFK